MFDIVLNMYLGKVPVSVANRARLFQNTFVLHKCKHANIAFPPKVLFKVFFRICAQ